MIQLRSKATFCPSPGCVYAPVAGLAKPLSQVDDPMIAGKLLGLGLAIQPCAGTVFAPVSGRVSVLAGSRHAVGIVSADGIEVLVHIGINTVNLNGKYFKALVAKGDEVRAGQRLIEFDRAAIIRSGYDVITPVIITNSDDYQEIAVVTGQTVQVLDKIMEVTSKQ